MCRNLRTLSCYRPRVLTLCVVGIVAALIVLANLSVEVRRRGAPPPRSARDFDLREADNGEAQGWPLRNLSYGWPLRWKQYVYVMQLSPYTIIGECHSLRRLAGNTVLWIAMLAASTVACEWLLRRYRPRFRWSVRAMLVGVGLVACGCGWFVAARERAELQDAIIEGADPVWVEHCGPEWLEFVGADRYRRHIVGARLDPDAHIGVFGIDKEQQEDYREKGRQLLNRLAQMQYLRHIDLDRTSLNQDIASALREMPRLQMLSIDIQKIAPGGIEALADSLRNLKELRVLRVSRDRGQPACPELLEAIGNVPQLEHLSLARMTLNGKGVESLARLRNLKSLSFDEIATDADDLATGQSLLSRLPVLPRLEAFVAWSSDIYNDDLEFLARLPRLKMLTVDSMLCTPAGLPKLASLTSLEDLAIGYTLISEEGLESLRSSTRLRRLHLQGFDKGPGEVLPAVDDSQVEGCRRALVLLRKLIPGIVIDARFSIHLGGEERLVRLPDNDLLEYEAIQKWREVVSQWRARGAPWRMPRVMAGP